MNILLDFITVRWRTGAGEYHRRVILTLIEYLRKEPREVKLYALYDSQFGVAYDELQEKALNQLYPICFVDIQGTNLVAVAQKYQIDRFFIACGQYIGQYKEVENLS